MKYRSRSYPIELASPIATGRGCCRRSNRASPQRSTFSTDGRAIGYAESTMGIVEAYKLGEIIGSPTAGTNGNINPFMLPEGSTVMWTGMWVRKHDGSPHHGVGIQPMLRVEPTAKGVHEGRDEVLEKALDRITLIAPLPLRRTVANAQSVRVYGVTASRGERRKSARP